MVVGVVGESEGLDEPQPGLAQPLLLGEQERQALPVHRVQVGPAGRDPAEVRALFAAVYTGAAWPARPWQLLAHVDAQGVDLVTRAAPGAIPARTYAGPDEVSAALAALPRSTDPAGRAPDPGSHRTPTRRQA